MKKQEFVSSLDKEEILLRISAHAKPAKRGYRLTTGSLLYRINDDGSFMLVKTPSMGRKRSGGFLR